MAEEETAVAPSAFADDDLERPLAAGSDDARYERIDELGHGGMGDVLLAFDRLIGREVALKSMNVGSGEDGGRFLREARVQGRLEHPAIVPVHDLGLDAGGRPFFTMKRVRGVTLDAVLRALRSGDEAAAREHGRARLLTAFAQVCLAVDFAHANGVLHCDLKPSNLMFGGFGEVYVLDWGIARSARADAPEDTPHGAPSRRSAVAGSAAYMAPEQIYAPLTVDRRADVYALGAILFELLVHAPLRGGGTSAERMARALEPVDVRAALRASGRDVPPELEELCVRATAWDPAERCETARAVAEGVQSFLAGDRDLELRRGLAKEHVERARALVADAGKQRLVSRVDAIREIGRALALDPTRHDGLELLVELLADPPAETPAEVLAELEAQSVAPRVASYRGGAFLFLGASALSIPLALYASIRSPGLFALAVGGWLAAAAIAFVSPRFDAFHERVPYMPVVAGAAALLSSVIHGPLIQLPVIVSLITCGAIMVGRPRMRKVAVVSGPLVVVLASLLAFLGWAPVHVEFAGESLHISGGAMEWNSRMNVTITAIHVLLMLSGVTFFLQHRRAREQAVRRAAVQSWQIRQLLPSVDEPRASFSGARASPSRG